MRTLVYYLLSMAVTYNCSLAQTNDYFPLAVGNYWVYKSEPTKNSDYEKRSFKTLIETKDTFNGNECYKMVYISQNIKEHGGSHLVGVDKNGNVVSYALGSGKFILTEWNPPLILLSNKLSIGMSWENRIEGYNESFPDSVLYAITTYQVESTQESVTIPAGTFDNCLKIREIHKNYDDEIASEIIRYYAKGVGRIMSLGLKPENNTFREELTEYTLNTE